MVIFYVFLALLGICVLYLIITLISSTSFSFIFSSTKKEQKRIVKAFDKAFKREPRRQKRHLRKAEYRYKKYLQRKKEKEEISSFRKVKWLL